MPQWENLTIMFTDIGGHTAIVGYRCQIAAVIRMQARAPERATPHSHEGQTRNRFFVKGLWSALQTHLQGVHGATLAIMPENIRHRAALLSRSSDAKLTRPAKESKPKPPLLISGSHHVTASR